MHTIVLIMYLNNVRSCCTHIICIHNGESEVGPDSRHAVIVFYSILEYIVSD